jgi:lysophospholipase L1-like esterase
MLDCTVAGDSIAVGTQMFRQDCALVAKSGINSWQWNKDYSSKLLDSRTVIISLGSNDHRGVKSIKELLALREKIKDACVVWILPAINDQGREAVTLVAEQYNDIVLPFARVQADRVHPSWAGYKQLAEESKVCNLNKR